MVVKLLLLILAFVSTISAGGVTCPTASFPKVLGGNSGQTYLYQIDYHSSTDSIVGVGSTFDQTLLGSNPRKSVGKGGLIALYKGTTMAL